MTPSEKYQVDLKDEVIIFDADQHHVIGSLNKLYESFIHVKNKDSVCV